MNRAKYTCNTCGIGFAKYKKWYDHSRRCAKRSARESNEEPKSVQRTLSNYLVKTVVPKATVPKVTSQKRKDSKTTYPKSRGIIKQHTHYDKTRRFLINQLEHAIVHNTSDIDLMYKIVQKHICLLRMDTELMDYHVVCFLKGEFYLHEGKVKAVVDDKFESNETRVLLHFGLLISDFYSALSRMICLLAANNRLDADCISLVSVLNNSSTEYGDKSKFERTRLKEAFVKVWQGMSRTDKTKAFNECVAAQKAST